MLVGCWCISLSQVQHPTDTIKVVLQISQNKYPSVWSAVSSTWKQAGFRGFYRGVAGPLMVVPLINAIVFGSYGQAKRWFGKDKDLTLTQLSLCGAWAGFVNSAVVGPIELVKTLMQKQLNYPDQPKKYKHSLDCAYKILKNNPRDILHGMVPTIYREVPAYFAQFWVYETVVRKVLTKQNQTVEDLSAPQLMIAGALAGAGCWLASYPMDVVKNNIQADYPRAIYKKHKFLFDGGFLHCARQIYAAKGVKGFWTGLAPFMTGVLPANAALFLAYEWTIKHLTT
eukprot:TRINITY_DN622_c0_g1_i5.p1 TRINITY_DN622_c0_g1~~TRINITY_DN622_c0_g1_i5.p1  ORF type:complete len:284 (+),score=49.24 TRINITY_DN622_c0_g1_i5:140-991(+)